MDSALSRPSSGIASPTRTMRSRTQSISSDRPSTIGHSLMSPPLSVSPEAAFIAASAASQIVTNDHDSHADAWYDRHGIEPAGETALVSPAALQLVNNFLDQLLFNFLSVARTTTLAALRPAVSDVLKPKLAKDAINQADEELREYLGGGDEDDFVQPHGADPNQDWDLELVWKRTRLRCMVYSSLGDMEEEDEDYYMEQENLEPGSQDGEDRDTEVISPAVAIFLTSILEFMGEQALVVAGQAAYHRMRSKVEKELKDGARGPADLADRILVEELDMERVALDRTLGRLWRAWKKRIRSPLLESSSRPFSRDSSRSMPHQGRQGSISEPPLPQKKGDDSEPKPEERLVEETAEDDVEDWVKAAAIPLPEGSRDVDEIEVPGLTAYSDDEDDADDETEDEQAPKRPRSMVLLSFKPSVSGSATPTTARPHSIFFSLSQPPRKRSNSLPTVGSTPSKKSASKPSDEELDSKQSEEAEASGGVPADEEADAAEEPAKAVTSPRLSAVKPLPIEDDEGSTEAQRRRWSRDGHIAAATAAAAATVTAAFPRKALPKEARLSDSEGEYEKPEILTSSRVSVGGRSTSSGADSIKGVPIQPGSLQRSASVHSARLVDVVGPKSPVRSRNSSVDTLERQPRSRPTSGSTPTIAEEKRRPKDIEAAAARAGLAGPASPVLRSPVEKAIQSRKHNQAISEAEEYVEAALSARSESTPSTATISTPSSAGVAPEELQSQIKTSQPIFGSVTRNHEPSSPRSQRSPREPPSSPGTKVTIISSSYADERPVVPSKSPMPPAAPPVQIPERSNWQQQVNGNTHSPSASIGVVSVDRSRARQEDSPEPQYAPPATGARPIHTSGSSGSGGTGRLKAVRTSEESSKASVARNFEELIQSDQTIQYTLTPESMRDIESSRSVHNTSPVVASRPRKSEDARVNNDRSRSSSNATDLKRTPSLNHGPLPMLTGLNSHPVNHAVAEAKSMPKAAGPSAKPSLSNSASKSRMNNPQARDARVPRESVMDMAEFIRSTGPTGENGPTPIRGLNGPVPSSTMGIDSPRRAASMRNRAQLQAREAINSKEDNSDLIDFIRRGPPASSNPRIPRNVAPFRTTMDSDQMSGAVGGRAVDANIPNVRYSQASTNVTDSSFNSQSALIKKQPSYQGPNAFDDDMMMMPKRKTRRVRDPYAIDFSDEEDGDDFVRPRPSPKVEKEESLADFLRNYAPPPEPAPPLKQSSVKKKTSAPSLMGRFGRGVGSSSQAANGGGRSVSDAPPPPGARGAKGYIPIQVNMPPGYDKYGPIETAPARPSQSSGRVAMKKFEPRDPISTSTRTSELADFLKNSAPPGMAAQYSPPIEDGSRGYGSRRKKTYA